MPREAVVVDGHGDSAVGIVELLVENGFIVHVLTSEAGAKRFIKHPVYIHVARGDYEEALSKIDLDKVEFAVILTDDDELNVKLGRKCRERGVPRVVVLIRDSRVENEISEEGIVPVYVSQCVIGRVGRLLNLKFARYTPIRGNIGILELLVTSDVKVLGYRIGELEVEYGVKACIIRNGDFVREQDSEVQEGDYLVIIGPLDRLRELAS